MVLALADRQRYRSVTKFNWGRAKYQPAERVTPDAADRWLAQFDQKLPKRASFLRRRAPTPRNSDVWIVVGELVSTSGRREVYHFASVAEAHAAGFTFAV